MIFTFLGSCPIRDSTGAVRTNNSTNYCLRLWQLYDIQTLMQHTYFLFSKTWSRQDYGSNCVPQGNDPLSIIHERGMYHGSLGNSVLTPDTTLANLSPAQEVDLLLIQRRFRNNILHGFQVYFSRDMNA